LDNENFWIFKTIPDDKSWRISLLRGFTIEEIAVEQKNYCFQFFCPPDHHFFLQADSQVERDSWMAAFQKIQASPLNQFRKSSIRDDVIKGAIKVFGESLNLQDKSKAILIDSTISTEDVIKLVLQKYQVLDNHEKYGLFERTAEGEEYLINDSDRPLVIKSFWESQNRQCNFAIKERYPNIGLIEVIQRSDGMRKTSQQTKDLANSISTNFIDFSNDSLQSIISILQDSLFLAGDSSLLVSNGNTSTDLLDPFIIHNRDRSLYPENEDDNYDVIKKRSHSVNEGNNNNNTNNFNQSAILGTGNGKNLLRLEAFGLETSELTTD